MLYAWIDNNGTLCATYSQKYAPEGAQAFDVTSVDDLKVANGQIQVKTADERLLAKKIGLIVELKELTKAYILQFYPDDKQKSDVADKEYWGSWLLAQNGAYTTDYIYKTAFQSAANILNGTSDLATEVSQFPAAEQPAWEQLIKIALRVGFVQRVKQEYRALYQQIQAVGTEAELQSITFNFNTAYPL